MMDIVINHGFTIIAGILVLALVLFLTLVMVMLRVAGKCDDHGNW